MAEYIIALVWGAVYLNNRMRHVNKRKAKKETLAQRQHGLTNQQIEQGVLNGWDTGDIFIGEGFDVIEIDKYPPNMTAEQARSIFLQNKAHALTSREKIFEFAWNEDGIVSPHDNKAAYMILASPSQVEPGMHPPTSQDYPGSTTGSKALQRWVKNHYVTTEDDHAQAYGVTPAMVAYYDLPFRPQPSN